jgi:transcriptional regulator with XRE-family HTH domain
MAAWPAVYAAMASLQPNRYRKMLRRLREARLAAGMSQRDVARRLGKAQSFVQKCEVGERRIDPIELEVFARIYRKPLAFFLEH